MERWKKIPRWEDLYEVSNFGRVRSLGRLARVLLPGKTKSGYHLVALCRGMNIQYRYIHRLVLLAFKGPAPLNFECCHRNGIRCDNRLRNLRWGSRSSNAMDRHKHGTLPNFAGEKAYFAKLSDEKVRWIRKNYKRFSLRAIGRKFGVAHGTVKAVIERTSWSHIN